MLESRWIAEQLEFYEGTHTTFIIPKYGNPFEFGEAGGGYDVKMWGTSTGTYLLWDKGGNRLNLYNAGLNIYGSSGIESFSFSSSDASADFNGINITYNDAFRTDTTGTATTGKVTLTTTSPRWQFLAPSSGSGDVMVKLPAASESGGISFIVGNVCSTGTGWAGGSNLILTTTGMGLSTGTVLDNLVQYQTAQCFCDGLTWRILASVT